MSESQIGASQPQVTIGKTPAGQLLLETPKTTRPQMYETWGSIWSYLGNPSDRYGKLASPRKLSMSVKLLMLCDPVIAFCTAYIASKLIKAHYEIRCEDAEIGYFFETMYKSFHQRFMRQVALASALGYLPLVKQYEFKRPEPDDPLAPPAWTASTTPYICTGFRHVWPEGAYPTFDADQLFTGFEHAEGKVDRLWAMWLTIGKVNAFGRYSGLGRLCYAYKTWWLGEFSYDQFAVHLQKAVDRVVAVGHPSGKTADGKSLSDIAAAVGDDVRAGATVTLPTETYTYVDESGVEKPSNVPKWWVKFMEGTENVGAFIEDADHFDSRKALGMMVPYQVFMQVRQSSLGGPTTADVLGQLATDRIVMDASEADEHLNQYLFPYLLQVNFGPNAPRVTKVTTGLNESDRAEMFELVKTLINRMDSLTADQLDERSLLNSLGLPLRPEAEGAAPAPERRAGDSEPPQAGADSGSTITIRPDNSTRILIHPNDEAHIAAEQVTPMVPDSTYDPNLNPSREALEHMLSEPVVPITDAEGDVTEEDIARVIAQIEDNPDIMNLESIEGMV